jgi:hypothetical protein
MYEVVKTTKKMLKDNKEDLDILTCNLYQCVLCKNVKIHLKIFFDSNNTLFTENIGKISIYRVVGFHVSVSVSKISYRRYIDISDIVHITTKNLFFELFLSKLHEVA